MINPLQVYITAHSPNSQARHLVTYWAVAGECIQSAQIEMKAEHNPSLGKCWYISDSHRKGVSGAEHFLKWQIAP